MNSCPVCSSNETFLYMKGIFDSETTSVIECKNCGLQFLDPMMSDAEEEEYYRNYYNSQKSRHYKTFTLKDIQNNALSHYEEYKDVYNDLIKDKRSILEIGSGTGGFLKFVKKYSPASEITSVEKSESNLDFLNDKKENAFDNIEFYQDVNSIGSTKNFDLIVAFGVLEHVRKSSLFLNSIVPLLNGNSSLLAFNIPNKRNPLIDIYSIEEFKKFTYMLQHCYTFTEKSLEILGKKVGLEIEKFNYIQVWSLDNHLSWLKNKKPKDFSSFTNILSKETINNYNNDLISRKITDLMMVVYKKTQV